MGNYITSSELEKRIGSERFKNLCGVPLTEQDALVAGIIERAEAVVDGFASARFETPLEKTGLVAEWTFCIAEYELYKRGPGASIPEKIKDSYQNTIAQLSDLSAGRLETGAVLKGKTTNLPPASVIASDRENLFDASSMNSF